MSAPEIPTHYVAICDECRTVKTFGSERERELWEKFHTHDQGQSC